MLIAGVLCLCAALATAALGLWTLSRPHNADPAHLVRRAIAPTQLAAVRLHSSTWLTTNAIIGSPAAGHSTAR